MQTKGILVVEDDGETREMLREMLALEGYEVSVAEHGAAALQYLHGYRPDLIVTDLMMPLIVGERFIELVRRRAEFAATPIVVLTAFKQVWGAAATKAGATEVLEKPKDLARLTETVWRLLAHR